MKLQPQSLTGDRLTATVASASHPGTIHEVHGSLSTMRVWCGPTCRARGEHRHHDAMRRLLDDLAAIRRNQEAMGDEVLSLQVQWLDPEKIGAVSLAWLCAQEILYSRQTGVAA